MDECFYFLCGMAVGLTIAIVVAAESARDAVEQVRQEYTVHDVVGVYKEQEAWKWE